MVTGLEWWVGGRTCSATTWQQHWRDENMLSQQYSARLKKLRCIRGAFQNDFTHIHRMHVNTCFFCWKQKRKNELTFVLWFINQETVLMIIFDSTPSSQLTDCSTFLSRRVRQEVWEQFHLTVELMIIDERMTIKHWIFSISWSTSWKSLWMNVLCLRLRYESMFQSQVCTTWRNKDRKK